jgi:hypothetical protein
MTFLFGLITGSFVSSIVAFCYGCIFGYGACARDWVRLRIECDETHGDVPTMPRGTCRDYVND